MAAITAEGIKARIAAMQSNRAEAGVHGAEAQRMMHRCKVIVHQCNGAIAELENLLAEVTREEGAPDAVPGVNQSAG